MTLHAQSMCLFCGERYLFLASEHRTPRDRARAECPFCGWVAVRTVTVVYDPERYELLTPYSAGKLEYDVKARCVDCSARYHGLTVDECYECGSSRLNWYRVLNNTSEPSHA